MITETQFALRKDVRPDPQQPRKDFPKEAQEELRESIRVHGITDALIVRPDPEKKAKFMLVEGERRWRVAGELHIERVPVIVREMSEADARQALWDCLPGGEPPPADTRTMPTPPLPVKWKRKAKVGPARRGGQGTARPTKPEPDRGDARPTSAAPPAVKLNLDKPKSLGAAMKALIRNQTRFTGEALRGLLLADPDTKELMEQNNGGLLGANLNYWAKQGYLDKTGEGALEATYTVVKREWFAA